MSTSSLRRHLMRTLVFPILGGILLVGGASCYSTYHEAAEIYDAEQVYFARGLLTLARQIDKRETINAGGAVRDDAYEKYIAFRVWKGGRLLLQSDNVQYFGPVTQTEGFVDRLIGDRFWRFYTERQGDIFVEVAEENEVRLDLVRHILGGIFIPQLVIIPLVAVIISFAVGRGLKPVEQLSQMVRGRRVNELTPMSTCNIPAELLPMVEAINDLMLRVDNAMRIEKNFTNYAAHEMRTPIAALKIQAQVILRTHDAEKQKQLLGELLATIDRTQRIIEQLLTYARMQHQQAALQRTDLRALVLEEVRYAVPRALEKHMSMVADDLAPCQALIQPDLLRLALSNLLDNAVKYVPQGGVIDVTLQPHGAGARLCVRDNGPGIAAADMPHVFDPFYRVTGNRVFGAGLGLTIVKWACELQHIRVTAEAGEAGGMCFTLHFSPATEGG